MYVVNENDYHSRCISWLNRLFSKNIVSYIFKSVDMLCIQQRLQLIISNIFTAYRLPMIANSSFRNAYNLWNTEYLKQGNMKQEECFGVLMKTLFSIFCDQERDASGPQSFTFSTLHYTILYCKGTKYTVCFFSSVCYIYYKFQSSRWISNFWGNAIMVLLYRSK